MLQEIVLISQTKLQFELLYFLIKILTRLMVAIRENFHVFMDGKENMLQLVNFLNLSTQILEEEILQCSKNVLNSDIQY